MLAPVTHGESSGAILITFKGAPAEKAIMLTCVRRYGAYPLSDLGPRRPK
jgi:hypothetical protein